MNNEENREKRVFEMPKKKKKKKKKTKKKKAKKKKTKKKITILYKIKTKSF